MQWISTRRAEGSGFYTWDTAEKVPTSARGPRIRDASRYRCRIPLPEGGYFKLRAEAKDADGRLAVDRDSFYALGPGYTAWTRYDHNRIDLVPERKTYKPGDTARIMIKSPWEQATALVTTEREGIRTHRRFALTSTQQSITVPITEEDIPNVYVSVLLVKGRSKDAHAGRRQRSGQAVVPPRLRRSSRSRTRASACTVTAKADKDEFRPANKAQVTVTVKDAPGQPALERGHALGRGLRRAVADRVPDAGRAESVYVRKALQVLTTDSRQRIVSRRVLTPKGGDEGGGGGEDRAPARCARTSACWRSGSDRSSPTPAARPRVDVTLPESLTTYRIMAVAADKASRFGSADSEIRVNKPLTHEADVPALPGARRQGVLRRRRHQPAARRRARRPSRSRASTRRFSRSTGGAKQTVDVAAGGAAEVKFDAVAKAIGKARIQMTRAARRRDATRSRTSIPVEVLVSPETVAAYGDTTPQAKREGHRCRPASSPGFGGLHWSSRRRRWSASARARATSSSIRTAARSSDRRARWRCCWPRISATRSRCPASTPKDLKTISQAQITQLEQYPVPGRRLRVLAGAVLLACRRISTSYVLHVFQVAGSLNYKVNAAVMEQGLRLPRRRARQGAARERELVPAVHGLAGVRGQGARRGRPEPGLATSRACTATSIGCRCSAHLSRRRDRRRRARAGPRLDRAAPPDEERHPARGRQRARRGAERSVSDLVLELERPLDRDRAEPLRAGRRRRDLDLRAMVRWMMAARKDGRWGNTQENALAMEALVTYYRIQKPRCPTSRPR